MATDLITPAEVAVQSDLLWRELFDVALQADGPVAMARRLGYSNHTLVSRIAKGHIEPSEKFRLRVVAAYHVVRCPHTGAEQARSECNRGLATPPTHNPGAMAHWRACQRCPHKPGSEGATHEQ